MAEAVEILPQNVADWFRNKSMKDFTVLIDCRPFLAYNSGHVLTAHNIHCPPIVKRRSGGCLPIENILRCTETRSKFLKGYFKYIVVYDENTSSMEDLTEDSNMYIVLRSLTEELHSPVYFIKGGYNVFQAVCPFMCVNNSSTESTESSPPIDIGECNETTETFINEAILQRAETLRDTVKYRPSQDQGDPEAILPWLYLGSAYHAMQEPNLLQFGINALLNMASKSDTLTPGPNFLHKRMAVEDSCTSDISTWFPEAIDFIESVRRAGGKVLVHCHAGISRSATVCIAYIMWYKHWTMEKAYDFLKSKRNLIAPNLNFMRQLLEFENQLEQNGRRRLSSSTSSTSSYMSAMSCCCDGEHVNSACVSAKSCQYCSANNLTKSQHFDFDITNISGHNQDSITPLSPFLLQQPPHRHKQVTAAAASITDTSNVYNATAPITFMSQAPRSASANLFSNSGKSENQDTLAVTSANDILISDNSSCLPQRPVSAKPVFSLPLTPCTKQANVFSFDSPICSPLSQCTNSPTLCHSPLVSPS